LLALEGRFESYTLGRELSLEKVKEIYKLYKKHGFQLSGLRAFDRYLTEEDFVTRRELVQRYKADPDLFARVQEEAAKELAAIPITSKGVKAGRKWFFAGWGRECVEWWTRANFAATGRLGRHEQIKSVLQLGGIGIGVLTPAAVFGSRMALRLWNRYAESNVAE
jgi:hypothetical protein